MKVSKEELLHIAKLANLKINDDESESYLRNLNDILNFADVINKLDTENISETIGSTDNVNVFREDEIKVFEDNAALLQNAPEEEDNMFKIPKVI
ncbi:MAG: Asp-tRNA(Asn)/Glu-tRNA(Gln) amidotransferase subunit GatC [Clostridia bacterium]|nr:Asp-tRNA(Asn)/Glu-tRNA(Gln) amidotransferase subunit GatC [Clostridiales bacterium]MBQ6991505.1 Asp-tRNA(Asn)/Glu-tRNA(Gln) amidotransferase subunit GatC [Clostridia bacterium]